MSGGRKPTSGFDGVSSVVGIERGERDREQAGAQVQARVDVDVHAERGRRIDPRAVRGQPGRHVDDVAAEPDRAELERAPVEVRAELLGDDDVVRGDGAVFSLENSIV